MGAFDGINALVTGSNRGIGFGFIQHLLKQPVQNVFAGVRSFNRAKELQQLAKNDSRLTIVELDVTSDSSINEAAKLVSSKLENEKGLNILINNAGIFNDKSNQENPIREKILQAFNVNVVGAIMTTAKFLPLLQRAATLEEPSKIVNMSSIAGSIENIPEQQFWMKNSTYSMTKASLNAHTKFFAFSDHYTNIITVAMHPGWVQTHDDEAELTVDEAVKTMLETIGRLKRKHSSSFIDNHGQLIPN